jgi:hypothetical protein
MNHRLAKLTYEAHRWKEEKSKGDEDRPAETVKIGRQREALNSTPGSLGKIVKKNA